MNDMTGAFGATAGTADAAVPTGWSAAEAAVEAAAVRVSARERPKLLRLVERRMPADAAAVRAALCEVRRRFWAARLVELAHGAGRAWVRAA
ncbi:MAG: RNA helicase, partial [Acetobacteraceae bacterium]|nr:RNA helicase [Acetobacteraceae bacterium]